MGTRVVMQEQHDFGESPGRVRWMALLSFLTLLQVTSICSALLHIIFRLNIIPTMKLYKGKSPPGSDSSPKNFKLLVFRGLWNDGTSASMYREIMLRNKIIFQISTLV
jgi:hypothetical protein